MVDKSEIEAWTYSKNHGKRARVFQFSDVANRRLRSKTAKSEKRRTWRKLHMAVDVDTHEIISAEMTLVNVGDSEVLPYLLNPLRRRISEVLGDGVYDTKECHKILKK